MTKVIKLIDKIFNEKIIPVSIAFDMHSLNAFYYDKTFYPFDAHSPKHSWRFAPGPINIYRLATDIYALTGEEAFEQTVRGYYEQLGISRPDNDEESLWVIYASLIMIPYLHMLGSSDTTKKGAAEVYQNFLRNYFAKIK